MLYRRGEVTKKQNIDLRYPQFKIVFSTIHHTINSLTTSDSLFIIMRRVIIALSSLSGLFLTMPLAASAADVFSVLVMVNRFLNGLVGIIITIAIIVFFW